MIVKRHMIKKSELELARINDRIGSVLDKIVKNDFLSIPVVDEEGKDLLGVVYKSDVYEGFFNSGLSKEEYLRQAVKAILTPKTVEIQTDSILEDASYLLSSVKQSFIPVYEGEKFVGILTPSAISKSYSKLLGIGKGIRLSLLVTNMSGRLAILSKSVADLGGNIISLSVEQVKVLSTARIILRVENCDIDKLLTSISKNGFKLERLDE